MKTYKVGRTRVAAGFSWIFVAVWAFLYLQQVWAALYCGAVASLTVRTLSRVLGLQSLRHMGSGVVAARL